MHIASQCAICSCTELCKNLAKAHKTESLLLLNQEKVNDFKAHMYFTIHNCIPGGILRGKNIFIPCPLHGPTGVSGAQHSDSRSGHPIFSARSRRVAVIAVHKVKVSIDSSQWDLFSSYWVFLTVERMKHVQATCSKQFFQSECTAGRSRSVYCHKSQATAWAILTVT